MASKYLHKFNTDNVHARAVIVGLVNLLNSKIQYDNIYSDTEFSTVTVPFYYNFGGDERFLQDYFLEWNDCITPQMADGNVDPIPRGIVTLESSTINTNQLTNRFVRANYVKQVGNEVLSYNSFLNSIPLTMNFAVVIAADTALDAFKIQQSVLEIFYKTQVFSVEFKGFRVPCQVGFPEDQGIEKTFEFTYQGETDIRFNVALQLDTYFPVTDKTTERFNGNRMNYPGGPNIEWSMDEKYLIPRFLFRSPMHEETYFSAGTLTFEWGNTGPITRVNLYYRIVGSTDWVPIVKNYQNTGVYVWDIPYLSIAGLEIPRENVKAFAITQTGNGSRLRAIIDGTGSVEKIIVFDGGMTYQNGDTINVSEDGVSTIQPTIGADLVSGIIAGATITAVGADFTPTPINKLEFKIANGNDERVYAILSHTIQFQAEVTDASDIITNVTPSITTLIENGFDIGQPLEGAGIIAGSTIIGYDETLNEIQISNTANLTSFLTHLTGGTVPGYITIK